MNTDNPFRSSDLGVMSPARCLCAMSVKSWKYTDNPFRSSDLRVMSPARCLCAMSVKIGNIPALGFDPRSSEL